MPVLQRCIIGRGDPDVTVAPVTINRWLIKASILRKHLHVKKLGIKKRTPVSSLRLLTVLEVKSPGEVKEIQLEN